jgi:hypothetical protein
MKRKQVAIFYLLVLLFVCAALGCLPLIPIRVAPVVPHPVYRLTFISLVGILWRLELAGIAYRWEWYTGVVVLTLIVLGIVSSVFLMTRLKRSLG